jgi:hypothetical protein
MKTTLVNILLRKEIIHWKRMKEMFGKFPNWASKLTFGIIVIILVTIGHYLFAIMHTAYEIFLFIFARQLFKANMQKMYYSTMIAVDMETQPLRPQMK